MSYVVDIIEDIVDTTSTALIADGVLISDINYMHGHPLEIIATLQKMTQEAVGQAAKYPLISLFQDFEEEHGKDETIEMKVSLNLAICMLTQPHYTAAQRMVTNFKPYLQPIYLEFIEQIYASKKFRIEGVTFPHNKTDRMFWGRQGLFSKDGNLFNDFIDAIEITNLELKVIPINCLTTKTLYG